MNSIEVQFPQIQIRNETIKNLNYPKPNQVNNCSDDSNFENENSGKGDKNAGNNPGDDDDFDDEDWANIIQEMSSFKRTLDKMIAK